VKIIGRNSPEPKEGDQSTNGSSEGFSSGNEMAKLRGLKRKQDESCLESDEERQQPRKPCEVLRLNLNQKNMPNALFSSKLLQMKKNKGGFTERNSLCPSQIMSQG